MGSLVSSLRAAAEPATPQTEAPCLQKPEQDIQVQDFSDDPTLEHNARKANVNLESEQQDNEKVSATQQNDKPLTKCGQLCEEQSSSSTKRTKTSSSPLPKKHVKRRRMLEQDNNLEEHEAAVVGDQQEKDAGVSTNRIEDSLDASVQPGSLARALYTMVLDSGEQGLTVREAGSKLMEQGLMDLVEQEDVPFTAQVARAMRTNPYFIEAKCGRYILWNTFLKSKEHNMRSLVETRPAELQYKRRKLKRVPKVEKSTSES